MAEEREKVTEEDKEDMEFALKNSKLDYDKRNIVESFNNLTKFMIVFSTKKVSMSY